jgi:hypothetical protein
MIRLPDTHYWNLHAKCAAGTLNPVERIELDALCSVYEREPQLNTPREPGAGNSLRSDK